MKETKIESLDLSVCKNLKKLYLGELKINDVKLSSLINVEKLDLTGKECKGIDLKTLLKSFWGKHKK